MDIELEISPNYCMFGFNFFQTDEDYDYREVNIYIFILKIHITW
jgi:hypothetical protein